MEACNPASDDKYYRFLGFGAGTESGLRVNTYERSGQIIRKLVD
jgi:hypothetical protein